MVKRFGKWMAMAAVAVLVSSVAVMAQGGKEFKTVATVSVASGDSLVQQLKTFGDLVGENLYGSVAREVSANQSADLLINAAIDGSQPAGLVVKVSTDGFSKQIVGFVPVKNFDAVRKVAEDALKLEVKECDTDGLYTVSRDGQSIYAKPMGGWLLLSDEADAFVAVGENPAEQLDGLDQEYAFAVRFQPCNVPFTVREMILMGLNQGLRELASHCPEKSPEADAKKEKLVGMVVERGRIVLTDTESVTYGVKVDATQGLRFTAICKAVDGSGMAEYFARLAEVKNPMDGLLPDTTAIAAGIFFPVDAQKTEIRKFLFGMVRECISKELDAGAAEKIASKVSEHTDESVSAGQVTAFIHQILDAHAAGIEAAVIRGGFAVIADPGRPTFFATVGCNGKWAEEIAGQIWEMAVKAAKKSGKCPIDVEKILTPNVAEVKDASIHLLSGPTWAEIAAAKKADSEDFKLATELLGERPQAATIFSRYGVGIVVARDPVELVKSRVAELTIVEAKPVLFEGFVSLRSMISLATMIHPSGNDAAVDAVLNASGSDPDRVTLKTTAEGRSVTTELKFDTGFIRGVAAGVKANP